MPRAFSGPAEFRAWLLENHARATELFVRCWKTQERHRGLTYRQALDEALCLGWIDGVRHGVDGASFSVRFSPRRTRSAWSAVNIARFEQLEKEGCVLPAGLAAFRARVKTEYLYERPPQALAPAFLKRFRSHPVAWRFFEAQPPWYRRTAASWVMSAKRRETRAKRLEGLIAHSQRRRAIPPLRRPGAPSARRRARHG